jgi:hypothetical protein
VRRFLESRGYRVYGNKSGYNVTRAFYSSDFDFGFSFNEFENVVINSTAIEPILAQFKLSPHDRKRKSIQYALERLPAVARLAHRKFVFVHIASPHSPFVFDQDGEPMPRNPVYDRTAWHQEQRAMDGWRQWYRQGYAAEIRGLGTYVVPAIESILANSVRPPIIIVQSDHGPRLGLIGESAEASDVEERMSILNAFYLPTRPQNKLYPEISSVNTFRLIFNEYFEKAIRCWRTVLTIPGLILIWST